MGHYGNIYPIKRFVCPGVSPDNEEEDEFLLDGEITTSSSSYGAHYTAMV